MTVSYVERTQADSETTAFYDKAEDRFDHAAQHLQGVRPHARSWEPSSPI